MLFILYMLNTESKFKSVHLQSLVLRYKHHLRKIFIHCRPYETVLSLLKSLLGVEFAFHKQVASYVANPHYKPSLLGSELKTQIMIVKPMIYIHIYGKGGCLIGLTGSKQTKTFVMKSAQFFRMGKKTRMRPC